MINSRDLTQLHPALERACRQLKRLLSECGYDMLVTSTYRDAEYQDSLYQQGRNKPGQIVTNAKAGQSIHNYKLAFDICKNLRNHEFDDNEFFNTAGRLGTQMGLVWGGNFKGLIDKPHFEFTNGLTIRELADGKTLPPDFMMDWEKSRNEEAELKPYPAKMLFNGKEIIVERILLDGFNYVKLRDLDKLGIYIGYDEALKMPVIAL